MNKRNLYIFYKKYDVWFDQVTYFLVMLNVVVLCLNTFQELNPYLQWFKAFELFMTVVFTIEYVLRCYFSYIKGNMFKYMFSVLGLIDLASILPYYLPFSGFKHSSFIKTLRLFRLLTMLKLYRYSEHVQTIVDVINHKKGDLIATFISILFVVLFCSYAMYVLEHEIQPDKIRNILDAVWWGIGTIATVGYGDIIPVTFWGKVIASILTLFGVGLVAIPSAILSAGFVELQNDKKAKKHKNNITD
jgi:voltage-gated potassium channel